MDGFGGRLTPGWRTWISSTAFTSIGSILSCQNTDVTCHFHILSWILFEVRRKELEGIGFDEPKGRIFAEDFRLDHDIIGSTRYRFSKLHDAEPPCIDYAPMGRQRRINGLASIAFSGQEPYAINGLVLSWS